ncbi:MAG: hypothetical protein ACTS3R_19695 [Inquilinaceae bacterium]
MKRQTNGRMLATIVALAGAMTIFWFGEAQAYIGPGAGLTLIGAVWGLVLAVVAALSFVVLWPLRRVWRRARTKPPRPVERADMAAGRTHRDRD